mmetsp:Transcript_60072/g.196151  ORF Transcript_60072/g.196151 Transcript_60072/m.196151 type:complete len:264 (+) Transcript_60072:433-1224(+)
MGNGTVACCGICFKSMRGEVAIAASIAACLAASTTLAIKIVEAGDPAGDDSTFPASPSFAAATTPSTRALNAAAALSVPHVPSSADVKPCFNFKIKPWVAAKLTGLPTARTGETDPKAAVDAVGTSLSCSCSSATPLHSEASASAGEPKPGEGLAVAADVPVSAPVRAPGLLAKSEPITAMLLPPGVAPDASEPGTGLPRGVKEPCPRGVPTGSTTAGTVAPPLKKAPAGATTEGATAKPPHSEGTRRGLCKTCDRGVTRPLA